MAIRAHKLRASLTILGVVVGVATVIAMVSIVTGFKNSVIRTFQSFGATLVNFRKFEPRFGAIDPLESERRRKDLTYEDALALRSAVPEMRAISPERYLWRTNTHLKYRGSEMTTAIIVGATPEYAIANNHGAAEGRFLTDADVEHAARVTVIGDDVRRSLFAGEVPLNKAIDISGAHYLVVGILEKKGTMLGRTMDNQVVLPFTSFDRQFPFVKNSHLDTLYISAIPHTPEQLSTIIEKGQALLRARRRVAFDKPNDFAIVTPDKLIQSVQSITRGVMGVLVLIAGISLLIGGVGVMNIMLVSVTERTRDIGLRRAVGARRRDIVVQFLVEATALTLLGGVLGVALGTAIPEAVHAAFDALPAETPLWAVMVGLLVSVSVGIFFGLYPAVKASRLDPVEALRHE
jgi:putative ABC transport system permease protein